MNTAKLSALLRRHALPILPYMLIFWFCSKLGTAYRLAAGADFLQKLNGCVSSINTAFSTLLPSLDLFDLAVGAVGATIIYAVVYIKKRNARKWRKDVEYGSARWSA